MKQNHICWKTAHPYLFLGYKVFITSQMSAVLPHMLGAANNNVYFKHGKSVCLFMLH